MVIVDKDELLEDLEEIEERVNSLLYAVRHADVEDEYKSPEGTLDRWKEQVLNMLPFECSMKFRIDVDEALSKFKGVY